MYTFISLVVLFWLYNLFTNKSVVRFLICIWYAFTAEFNARPFSRLALWLSRGTKSRWTIPTRVGPAICQKVKIYEGSAIVPWILRDCYLAFSYIYPVSAIMSPDLARLFCRTSVSCDVLLISVHVPGALHLTREKKRGREREFSRVWN